MKTFNRASIIGRLGHDVEIRQTSSGKIVANLSLATDFKRADGSSETTWHRVVLWDHLAQIASRYLRRGQPAYVEGRLSTNEWTDRNGNLQRRTEIVARDLILLGGPPPSRPANPANPDQRSSTEPTTSEQPSVMSDGNGGAYSARTGGPIEQHSGSPEGQRIDGEEGAEVSDDIPF